MHPWHDVDPGDSAPELVRAVVELSKGSKNKYELDKTTGLLSVDRVLFSSVVYPANYGFIPQTWCDDGDPLDILVLGQEPVVPLALIWASPIGVMKMRDQGQEDDKIVAVHARDPEYRGYRSIRELPPHRLDELRKFFEDYKELEGKEVTVDEFLDRDAALQIVRRALEDYRNREFQSGGVS